ncbi:hypothetical protein DL770_005490 [Monosporascus sp. CRB-9-2]|nr:hypothetical protein DL770_005490 [Monosporascus sp. CRB-9-2]
MEAPVFGPRSLSEGPYQADDAIEALFSKILEQLEATDFFGRSTSPSIFIVYAHDNHDEGIAANAWCVHNLIKWLKAIRTRVLSDKSPLPLWSTREGGAAAAQNILSNQFCLLPASTRSDSAGTINSVDKVLVCGSRLLERYYEDDFTSSYIDTVEAVYAEAQQTRDVLQSRIQHLVETKRSYGHDGHGIIPISLNGGDMKYLPFLRNSDLRLKSSANTADLRRLFFKLLQQIYTEEDALIGQFKECYEHAQKRLQNEAGIAPPDFQVIIDQEIPKAQNAWLQLQTAAIRDRGWEKELGRRTESRMPVSNHFVDRPSDIADLEQRLLPQRHAHGQNRRRIFILYGLGGIGKTQLAIHFARRYKDTFSSVFWLDGRSEDRLRQSIARCASRIPDGQIAKRSRRQVLGSDDLDTVVADVLAWLASPGNTDWLLVFDNVDQDHEQGGMTGAYDVRRYLPGDQGSVLITSRLSRLAQLGDSKQLRKVDKDVAKAIFQTWYGGQLDTGSEELLSLLDGLPLALAQAASYLRETGLECSTYIDLYQNQWDDLIKFADISGSPLLDYERSIGTTWTISFKAIEAKRSYHLICFEQPRVEMVGRNGFERRQVTKSNFSILWEFYCATQ